MKHFSVFSLLLFYTSFALAGSTGGIGGMGRPQLALSFAENLQSNGTLISSFGNTKYVSVPPDDLVVIKESFNSNDPVIVRDSISIQAFTVDSIGDSAVSLQNTEGVNIVIFSDKEIGN